MDEYNTQQGENYNAKVDYTVKHQDNTMTYAVNSTSISTGSMYQSKQETSTTIPSKCPRGATLGAIGTCCGLQCTRKCAEPAGSFV